MKNRNAITWIALTAVIFAFFRWLFGIALPEIALEFSLGTTVVIVAGLFAGRAVTLLAIRTREIRNWLRISMLLAAFILTGVVAIAFLLNAMIGETTLFRFAITVVLLFLVVAAFGSVVSIVRHEYRRRISVAQAAQAQSKSELQLLQSQLSPHFLFNTLNNLYGLSLSDPQQVPPLLLKLSELLRYTVYDVKELYVPLKDEVDYILNYVAFERLRLGERLKIDIDFDRSFDDRCKIPPLLLIVFVENAFKHSRTTGDQPVSIRLILRKKDRSIVFLARNSRSSDYISATREKHSGFGLDNVQKRLNLLYPSKHTFNIDRTELEFNVYLELDCQ